MQEIKLDDQVLSYPRGNYSEKLRLNVVSIDHNISFDTSVNKIPINSKLT